MKRGKGQNMEDKLVEEGTYHQAVEVGEGQEGQKWFPLISYCEGDLVNEGRT